MSHAVSIRRDTPLTDAELRTADTATRRWYLRVLTLMQATGCSFDWALAAIRESDQHFLSDDDAQPGTGDRVLV